MISNVIVKRMLSISIVGAGLIAGASLAGAATRTVCYNVLFKDLRDDCPLSSDAGVRRACQQSSFSFSTSAGTYSNPVGMSLEIWDHDDDGEDEYIGTWKIGGTGTRCAIFEWEGEAYSTTEANPDPYVVLKSEVHAVGGDDTKVRAIGPTGGAYGGVTWRTWYIANCAAGSSCMFGGYLLATTDSTTQRGGRLQALDSAQHMLQVYGSIMDDDEIDMKWPCEGSASYNRGLFTIEGIDADDCTSDPNDIGDENRVGQSATHELGHVLQMMMFEQDDLVSECGDSHSLRKPEYESCAATEGFADYVAAASFWDPDDTGSQPSRWGFDYEEAEPVESTCSDNSGIEGMVARSFWDLDDGNNESGESPARYGDLNDSDELSIALGWDLFADGTDDREDREGDDDGVNLWDYWDNNESRFDSYFATTLIYHNCMDSQDSH